MGKVAFGHRDQEKIADALEKMLRQETNSPNPISYQVEDTQTINASTVMGEIVHAAFGGERSSIQLFTLHFSMPQPRPLELRVQINKQGIGSYAAPLLYAVTLAKPVGGKVDLAAGNKVTFIGDPAVTAKLGSDLSGRLQKLLRPRMQAGAFTVSINPFFKILPDGQTSTMIVYTLPRSTNFGFSSTLDAKEVLDVAAIVEAAL